jgi:OHCU decarboxylase
MRSNPTDYELVAPGSLPEVLSLIAKQPGEWLPIAGGTDVMVQYAAGKLAAKKLVSVWNLPELRQIEVSESDVVIGAASTYSDLREHEVISREFSLLANSASWTGGIANQNRGTLGGNIVNASPAADSLPALLVYEADLILISARGERRVRYTDFHTGYKNMLLAPDELIRAISLPRRFSGYISYSRKVGARNAQAISKVCVAALGRIIDGIATDIRIAAGSVAPVPIRLRETEHFLEGKVIDQNVMQSARKIAIAEIRPINDIRSTAAYRSAVLANLIAEFLDKLSARPINDVLARWNQLPPPQAADAILPCCGSSAWARALATQRPLLNESALFSASDDIWNKLPPHDWMEAFSKHPRIGERKAPPAASSQSASWSAQEQQNVTQAAESAQQDLASANHEYEQRFGRVFIVCATGKSAEEMLDILRHRLQNDDDTELQAAAEEQRKITNIRLKKWLNS